MEGITRLVTESLARHGFDRPLDYRRLHWSRWFRCESHHSLLHVPSKPGVFALAEEIMDLDTPRPEGENGAPEAPRRMLAVTQFFEDDDMAFVLDRMLATQNPMRPRLASGRYFVRFVVIEDQSQRRNICSALNQWIVSSAEKASGIGSHFASSLELTPQTEYVPAANDSQQSLFAGASDIQVAADAFVRPTAAGSTDAHAATGAMPAPSGVEGPDSGTALGLSSSTSTSTVPQLDSGAATNIHCPSPFPSGF